MVFIALVPLLLLIDGQSAGRAFWIAALSGFLFFPVTLYWFICMAWSAGIPVFLSVLAWLLLCLYLCLYFGLFGVGVVYFTRFGAGIRLFLLAAFWVVLEFIREHLLSGFGWLGLGYAPYRYLPLIQIADITGVFGISYLVVLVNLCIKEIILRRGKLTWVLARATAVTVLLIIAVLMYGQIRLNTLRDTPAEKVVLTIVQPNIDQQTKWYPSAWPEIMDELLTLTRRAVQHASADLVLWPETSFPGYLWEDPQGFERLKNFVRHTGRPLLFGVVTSQNGSIYNSALMLSSSGQVIGKYDKRHLVPFGEYLPLRQVLPFLGALIPIADFTPGTKLTRFPIPGKKGGVFSVVICFEDTVARVVGGFVRNGAHLLINLTNDAWFMDTHEPMLHLQAAVFRAVENRRALVRAANTGISCVVEPTGNITSRLADAQGKETFIPGSVTTQAGLSDTLTLYTRYGDIFSVICLAAVGMAGLMRKNHFNKVEEY